MEQRRLFECLKVFIVLYQSSINERKKMSYLKKLLLAAALMISGTAAATMSAQHIEASAKTVNSNELQSYLPAKYYTYYFKQTTKGKKYTFKRKYSHDLAEFIAPNTSDSIAAPYRYYYTKGTYSLSAYSEDPIFFIDAPLKPGKIMKEDFFGYMLKYKIVTTSKKFKLNGTQYKNVIVVKDQRIGTYYYLAKNKGVVLTKNKKQKFREELLKVSY